MSRIENTSKNAIWAIVANVIATAFGVINRIVFMNVLGETYLGISSLFGSILTVLTFADLGLANAFTFCFYKPIASNDTKHIQTLLNAFKKVLNKVVIVICVLGIAVVPFLRI